MRTRHVAYGLDLDASFPLAGMSDAAREDRCAATLERLPSLALELREPDELDGAWSGADDPPAWTGRLGDGCTLAIERGVADDVLLTYGDLDGDHARFRLDAARELARRSARDRGAQRHGQDDARARADPAWMGPVC